MKLSDRVDILSNIGPARKKTLEEMSVTTVKELLEYFPRDYEDRSLTTKINELEEGEKYTVIAKIQAKPKLARVNSLVIVTAVIGDNTGAINAVWFNQSYLASSLKQGEVYAFSGKTTERYNRLQLDNPEFEIYSSYSLNIGRIVPIYSLAKKLSQKIFRGLINDAITNTKQEFEEFLPSKILDEYRLCPRNFAVKNIHFPEDKDAFFKARRRLVFEELMLLQLRLIQLKGDITEQKSKFKLEDVDCSPVCKALGFTLTDAQKKTVDEALNDMSSGKVMNRLIQGDVGSGKTAVAAIVAYCAAKNGMQVAIMAPTDVLANQHFNNLGKLFGKLGINVALLTSSVKGQARKSVYSDIENGSVSLVIGTHAIIQESVHFKKLGLVITDEQHRFGVRQRESLFLKGERPHTLVMTATPIPRTLALVLYGDLDISVIDSLPPGRQSIDTFAVGTDYYPRLYDFIKKQVAQGGQCYIICPVIEDGNLKELKSVVSYGEELSKSHLSGLNVAVLHGKMKAEQKQEILESFACGKTDVLVSTTVIEVGIDVPNACIMLIENADRFGLSALHQLRGRVGRGKRKSYCILVSDKKNKVAKQRFNAMCKSNDGFYISEKDMELRGPGDFFGTRQHGLPDFKIANLYRDTEILKQVQQATLALCKKDLHLENSENRALKEKMSELYSEENKDICL